MPRDTTDLYINDKFGWRACVNASGEVSLKGSPIATLRNSSPVSRYLYIDLWWEHTTVSYTAVFVVNDNRILQWFAPRYFKTCFLARSSRSLCTTGLVKLVSQHSTATSIHCCQLSSCYLLFIHLSGHLGFKRICVL